MLTGFSPVNGGRPATISYITMPSEYRSLRGSGWAPWACSGEKYVAVPITAPAWVRLDSVAEFIARAMPKSATFTWPLDADEDVGRLDVAVHEPGFVGEVRGRRRPRWRSPPPAWP